MRRSRLFQILLRAVERGGDPQQLLRDAPWLRPALGRELLAA